MSATSAYLEGLIEECSGFSRFQWIMFSLMMYSKVAITWNMMIMTFDGAIPDWQCGFTNYSNPGTTPSIDMNDLYYTEGQCYPPQNVTVQNCQEYKFSNNMNTIVSEWTLICDKDWVASSITTIQMATILVSCIASGHLADLIGRKPTYFLSLAVITVLNIAAGISTSWKMFAVFRVLLIFCLGAAMTVFYNYLIEFIPAKRRSVAIAFPVWSIWTCALAFVAMWLHDWRYLQFSTAVLILPCVFMWWMSCGYGYYAISFGVQSLSGSLYLNMFLLSVVEIPAQASSYYLTNRFGRKRMAIVSLLAAGITGFIVAALQISDLEMKDSLINGFALASKMSVIVAWATLFMLSTESYPTVVRNIGIGMLNSFARVGGLIAPQLVYVSNHLPGAMYFVFGGLMVLSSFSLIFMQETNKKPMEDGIATEKKGGEEMQSLQIETSI